MINQYFGTKELYSVTLRANCRMTFGDREVEKGEAVLSFERVDISQLNENVTAIMARGGWGNMPRVIWEDRSEVVFRIEEGVMNDIGMGLLFSAKMLKDGKRFATYIPKREGPFELEKGTITLEHAPDLDKPLFCYVYERDCIQRKVPYKIKGKILTIEDKDPYAEYIVDYYYKYGNESLMYVVDKERFTGTFSLEGKFYTKDENEGLNVTNILTMPKVRVVSSINLHLGEGVNPTVSAFNIIAMPTMTDNSHDELLDIIRLPEDIDGEI